MDVRNNGSPFQLDHSYAPSAAPSPSSAGPAIRTRDIPGILRRKSRFLLFGCLIGLILGLSYFVFVPTLYKSSARILLDRSVTKYLQANKIVHDPTYDEAEIASQIYILSSESIVVPVVRSMHLTQDSEFVGIPNGDGAPIVEDVANVISVTFALEDPNKAADIANAIADTYITNTLEAKLKSQI